jgi:hypothetical protein
MTVSATSPTKVKQIQMPVISLISARIRGKMKEWLDREQGLWLK